MAFDLFNSTCSSMLNAIAPLRAKGGKTKIDPWLNEDTRELRRACRRAEPGGRRINYRCHSKFYRML